MTYTKVELANPDEVDSTTDNLSVVTIPTTARKILAEKFLSVCGGRVECQLTREMLHDFAGMRTKFHNDRLFTLIKEQNKAKGRNNNPNPENITYADFMAFVTQYCAGNEASKTKLLFDMYDCDGNGRLDERELIQMLRASMDENKLELDDTMLRDLAKTLLEEGLGETDAATKGASLGLTEFRKLFEGHEELIKNLSTVIEKWLEPIQEQKKRRPGPQRCSQMCHWLQENATFAFWVNAFFAVNLILFVVRLYIFYEEDFKGFWALALARGFGWCLNFSSSFILLTMMRQVLTRLRPTLFFNIFPIDDHKKFHGIVGHWIVLASMFHVTAHLINLKFVIDTNYPNEDWFWNYLTYLSNIEAAPTLGLIPGFAYLSGLVLICVLIFMFVFTLSCVRRNGYFHVFYISHIVGYPIFYIMLVLHCQNFWKWFLGPAIIFGIEQILRTYNNWIGYSTMVKMGVILPSKVTNLVIKRPPGFNFSPGDYIFINIPYLSWFEYHAFTISSAPENWDELSLHIRAVGPWTENLYNFFNYVKKMADFKVDYPHIEKLAVDDSKNRIVKNLGISSRHLHSMTERDYIGSDRGLGRMLKSDPSSKPTLRRNRTLPRNFNLTTISNYNYQVRQPDTVVLANVETETVAELRQHNWKDRMITITKNMFVDHKPEELLTPLVESGPESQLPTEYTRVYGKPLKVYIDGPYGAPSSEIFRAEHAVLIGAGIGVTPFASILQSIMYRHWATKRTCPQCSCKYSHGFQTQLNRLKKVDFFWTNPEQNAFTWFVSLLSKLEIEQEELDGELDRFLDIHMYMTKALQRNDMKAVALQLVLDLFYERNKRDALTTLKARMNAGRPVWREVFNKIKAQNQGAVSVFFCGPKAMGNEISQLCTQYGFSFRTETF